MKGNRDAKDSAILERNSKRLNHEAADVLGYQSHNIPEHDDEAPLKIDFSKGVRGLHYIAPDDEGWAPAKPGSDKRKSAGGTESSVHQKT